MKRLARLVVLLLIAILVIVACAPAHAPASEPTTAPTLVPATPVPATLVPEVTPTPAPTERVQGNVLIKYVYPDGFNSIFTIPLPPTSAQLHFTKEAGNWQRLPILETFTSKYPLIKFCYEEKSIIDSYGINGYCENRTVEIQPLEIKSETTVVYSVNAEGVDYENNLIISSLQTDNKQLDFRIDLAANTFSYTYLGGWEFTWNEKITTTLRGFGYTDISDSLTTEAIPGGRYTIKLTK